MSDETEATPMRRALVMLALTASAEAAFLLPFVLPRIFRPTMLAAFGLTNLELGLAFSAYGWVAMASYFLGGPIADRFGPRAMMALALVLTGSLGGVLLLSPSVATITVLYAAWGLTSVLLFWAALIRATREWGGTDSSGRAFGLLDGVRGLIAASLSTASVAVFAWALPGTSAEATLADNTAALRVVIVCYMAFVGLSAGLVWLVLPAGSGTDRAPADRTDQTGGMAALKQVLRMPQVYLQGLIVMCAYVAYKGSDDFSLLAAEGWGMDDVEAAHFGTISFWVRPIAALGAGLLADRVRGSRVILVCFVALAAGDAVVASGVLSTDVPAALVGAVAGTSVFIYALRGVYFALFPQARVPLAVTGTAVGLVSFVGYTPDIFFGPLMGVLLDRSPGITGHRHLFWVLSGFAVLGAVITIAFERVAARAPALPANAGAP